MPLLNDTWLSILRVVGLCSFGVALAGLILMQPGVMMIGIILAVLCAYITVLQASLRRAALRRADAATCSVCGYHHDFTRERAASPDARCPERGAPLA